MRSLGISVGPNRTDHAWCGATWKIGNGEMGKLGSCETGKRQTGNGELGGNAGM